MIRTSKDDGEIVDGDVVQSKETDLIRKPQETPTPSKVVQNKVLVIGVIALLIIGLGSGYGIGNFMLQPRLIELEINKEVLGSQIIALESQISDLEEKEVQLEQAKVDINDLTRQIMNIERDKEDLFQTLSSTQDTLNSLEEELLSEKNELETTINKLQLSESEKQNMENKLESVEDTISRFKSDKLLLVEIRKEVPTTRAEASEFWNNMRAIATTSDPSLALSADKVLSSIGPYFNWVEAAPDPDVNEDGVVDDEYLEWFFNPPLGTFGYFDDIQAFYNDAFLVIIIRIDAALSLVV